nr:hypothetical protein [Simkaniaceae bacterium]
YTSLQERLQQLTEQLVPATVLNMTPYVYSHLINAPELTKENKNRFLTGTRLHLDLYLDNFSVIDPKRTQEIIKTLVKAARLYITLLPQFRLHSSQITTLRATIQELDLSCPGRPSVAYTPPPLSLPKKSCERKIPSSQSKLLKSIESFHKLKPIIEIALDPWGCRTQEDVIINSGSTQLRMRASLRDSLEPNPRFRQYRTITPYYKMLREYCLILPQIEARCPPVGEEIGRIIETMTQLDPCLGRESQKTLTAWRDTYTTLHGESPIFRPSHPFWPEIQTLYARYKREYESYCCC